MALYLKELLLDLYFSNPSFADIAIIWHIGILKEGKEIILAFEETVFKLVEILMKMRHTLISSPKIYWTCL